MTQFFISYKRVDQAFAHELWRHVNTEPGFTGWIDMDIIASDNWTEMIDNQLDLSFGVLLILTPEALQSHYVTYEWAYILGGQKYVVPILLKPIDETKLHKRLDLTQQIDFTKSDYMNPNDPMWKELFRHLKELKTRKEMPEAVMNWQNKIRLSGDPLEWQRYIATIVDNQHPRASEALVEFFDDFSPQKAIDAALGFAQMTDYADSQAVEGLRRGLDRKDTYFELVATALGKIGGDEAGACLLAALLTVKENPTRETTLVKNIGHAKYRGALPQLHSILSQKLNIELRRSVIETLGEIGAADSLPILLEIIQNPETSREILVWCVEALGKIESPSTVAEVTKIIDYYMRVPSTHNYSIADTGLRALLARGNDEVVPTLRRYRDNGSVRNEITTFLSKKGF